MLNLLLTWNVRQYLVLCDHYQTCSQKITFLHNSQFSRDDFRWQISALAGNFHGWSTKWQQNMLPLRWTSRDCNKSLINFFIFAFRTIWQIPFSLYPMEWIAHHHFHFPLDTWTSIHRLSWMEHKAKLVLHNLLV